jgi:chemotaxis protein histidine kinase CheA
MNKELIDDFVSEIRVIHLDLKANVNTQLNAQKLDKKLFENFGQLVDRIYGTAMTLGYTEIGKYFLAIKNISYLSSQCDREVGQKKALRMMMECVDNMDKICNSIYKKEELKTLNRLFIGEIAKAERMARADFQNITRKSVA